MIQNEFAGRIFTNDASAITRQGLRLFAIFDQLFVKIFLLGLRATI
jgi:hypothetical protein